MTKDEIFVFFVLLKKVTLLCAVAAMGIAAVAGVSLQNRAQLSDVALANIEALASGEASIGSVGHETLCNVGGINMGGVIIGGCSATIVWCDGQGEGCTPVACPKHGIRN